MANQYQSFALSTLAAYFLHIVVNNNNLLKFPTTVRNLTRLLLNGVQSETGNQQDGFRLSHEDLAAHFDFFEDLGFCFPSNASSGPLGRILDREARQEA